MIDANKHAHCSQLQIHLRTTEGHLEGSINDNGIGFSPDYALTREDALLHFGLRSAIERVRIAAGTLAITSSPGRGTTIQLCLPIPEVGNSESVARSLALPTPGRLWISNARSPLPARAGAPRVAPCMKAIFKGDRS